MTSIFSTTFDPKYSFFVPIAAWTWSKLGITSICFTPHTTRPSNSMDMMDLIFKTMRNNNIHCDLYFFKSEKEKEATYSQVSRLFAACIEELPKDEVLVTTDCDMLIFGNKFKELNNGNINILGGDLMDDSSKQYPMCYLSMPVSTWQYVMNTNGKTFQDKLDETVGVIECEHFRGNQWSLDQNMIYSAIKDKPELNPIIHNRAKYPERFATNRIDRDDSFFMDRLNADIIDYHCHRPAYEEENFNKMMAVISYFYPYEDLSWISNYRQDFLKLI